MNRHVLNWSVISSLFGFKSLTGGAHSGRAFYILAWGISCPRKDISADLTTGDSNWNINARVSNLKGEHPQALIGFIIEVDLNPKFSPRKHPHPAPAIPADRGPSGPTRNKTPSSNAKEILIKSQLLSVGRGRQDSWNDLRQIWS